MSEIGVPAHPVMVPEDERPEIILALEAVVVQAKALEEVSEEDDDAGEE